MKGKIFASGCGTLNNRCIPLTYAFLNKQAVLRLCPIYDELLHQPAHPRFVKHTYPNAYRIFRTLWCNFALLILELRWYVETASVCSLVARCKLW
jgi:hypothetical protein